MIYTEKNHLMLTRGKPRVRWLFQDEMQNLKRVFRLVLRTISYCDALWLSVILCRFKLILGCLAGGGSITSFSSSTLLRELDCSMISPLSSSLSSSSSSSSSSDVGSSVTVSHLRTQTDNWTSQRCAPPPAPTFVQVWRVSALDTAGKLQQRRQIKISNAACALSRQEYILLP